MSYTSVYYYALIALTVGLYYALKKQYRWIILLVSSMIFYALIIQSPFQMALFAAVIVISWFSGKLIEQHPDRRTLWTGLVLSLLPLLAVRLDAWQVMYLHGSARLLVPAGISFFSLQAAAYLVDIYKGKIQAQKNLLRYALFIAWFPQIIQGPIPRYEQLADQLNEGHEYDTDRFMKGIQLIIWGFFLKFMIADKAAPYVNTIFADYNAYQGFPVLMAGLLYSLQIYADFLACTTMSQGVSALFGITLADNFKHPYHSASIQEFWRRWHISLSSWLRDYVYIPLGGSRKGTFRRYVNLVIVFLVSGIWHGTGLTFIAWGLLHAFYQIFGAYTKNARDAFWQKTGISAGARHIISVISTLFLVMTGWIIFRASSLRAALRMILNLFVVNPWTLTDGTLLRCGLDTADWTVLLLSAAVLFMAEHIQKKIVIRDWFQKQNTAVRWTVYFLAIWCIWLLGSYGYGFDASDFIYGGF